MPRPIFSSCFPPSLKATALVWQQILSYRGQNTLFAPSNAKKRQPGPEICPLTSPGVRWGGAGGAARQDSVGSWPLDLPPRAGITAPYLPYTTYRHESRDIRYSTARKRRQWAGTGGGVGSQESNLRSQVKSAGGVARQPGHPWGRSWAHFDAHNAS